MRLRVPRLVVRRARQFWVQALSLLLIAAGALTGAITVASPASAAASSPADTFIRNSQQFYAYVGPGENLDISFVKAFDFEPSVDAVITVRAPDGTAQTCTVVATAPANTAAGTCDWSSLTSATPGVWQVDFHTGAAVTASDLFTWEIGVQAGTTDQSGRVWSELYRMRQPATSTSVNLDLWYLNEQGFLYEATYGDYNGIDSVFGSNATGNALAGTCVPAYESYDILGPSADPQFYTPTAGECGPQYRIFFEQPDPSMPASTTDWTGGTTWLNPTITLPTLEDLAFAQEPATAVKSGEFSVSVTDFVGNAVLQIDANNDGDYDDPEDRSIPVAVAGDDTYTILFDGLDGQGNPISLLDTIGARVLIDQVGEIHFVNTDVERRAGGISVTALTGPAVGSSTIYWNDTNLDPAGRACLTPQVDGRAGVDSSGGVHDWDCNPAGGANANNGVNGAWGDARQIDDWTYASVALQDAIVIPGDADFGDAPESYGTALASDGPHHGFLDDLTLGAAYDAEPDGLPTAGATGDDANGDADEDGVASPLYVAVGADTTISVTATNNTAEPATLAGWVDIDNSGTFEPGELVSVSVPANSGTVAYPLTFPAATVAGDSFARFRLYSGTPTDIVPTGGWASGEVEDYRVHWYSTEIVKVPVGKPVANADGTHTVRFRLTVTRQGTGPVYDLDDDFAVGRGITLNSVTSANVSPGGIATVDDWDAATSTLSIVDDQPIGAGVTHEYLVTANATVDGAVMSYEDSNCTLGQPESGTGFLNTAKVTTGGIELTDQACPQIADVEIEKTVTSGPTPVGGGEYQVVYQIDVTNKHAAATEYDLDDVLKYGEAVTLVGQPQATAITGGLSPLENQWDSPSTTLRIQTDEPIPAAAGPNAPIVHSYRVTVRVTLEVEGVTVENTNCTLTTTESGTGLMNTARITVDEQRSEATACPPTPTPAAGEFTYSKTSDPKPGSVVRTGDTITYTVDVNQVGAGAVKGASIVDDLSKVLDDADYNGDVKATSGSVSVSGGKLTWTGDLAVGAKVSITYSVTVVDGGDDKLVNVVTGGKGGPGGPGGACVPAPDQNPGCTTTHTKRDSFDLTLAKRVVSGAQATVGDRVRYRLQVSNKGPDTASGPIKLIDPLPKGLELVSAKGKGWKCQAFKASDKVKCVRKKGLGADRKAPPVFVVAKATRAATGRVVNVAKVSVAGEEVRSNNHDNAAITVVPAQLPSTGFRQLPRGV